MIKRIQNWPNLRKYGKWEYKKLLYTGLLNVCSNSLSLILFYGSFLSRMFHSYGDVTITGEGLQILTFARISWPLSSEGYLTCHTYCNIGSPFVIIIRTLDTYTCCRAFGSGAATSRLSVAVGIRIANFPNARQTL